MPRRSAALAVAGLATALTVCLVLYPDLAFHAALRGLRLWWFVVFPALLPFFVAGQVLMGLGVVHALGVVLERGMRPLFNVPGVGAFVVAMGLASGYPIGAVLTARLVKSGDLDIAEAERLMSFCNTADPLFMAGAVAVGMFHRPELAGVIMAAHYLAALATGLLMRFHGVRGRPGRSPAVAHDGGQRGSVLGRAINALWAARQKDGRSLGAVFGDAVRDSVETLLLVGGSIIVFAVVIDVLQRVGAVGAAAEVLSWALGPLGVGRQAAASLVSGVFEITIGTQAASVVHAPLLQRVMLSGAIIAWSGLSVFAQVAAVTQGTGVSMKPYIFARVIQAVLAAAFTFCLWNPGWSAPLAVPALALPRAAMAGLPAFGALFLESVRWLALPLGLCMAAGLAAAGATVLRGTVFGWWSRPIADRVARRTTG